MSSWMPAFNPQLMQAALAQQKGAAPGAMPGRQIGPQPVPAAPVLPPGGQPMPPATAGAPKPVNVPTFHQAAAPSDAPPGAAPPSQISDMPLPTPTAPPAAPGASDDPALNPWAKAVEQGKSAVDTERQRVNTIQGEQPTPPNRADFKPPLWKKIAAPFVGALAAQNHGNPEPAVDATLNGPWNRAVQGYGAQNEAWKEKMGAEEKVGIPLAADTARIAQEGFTNYESNRREANAENRTAEETRHNQAREDERDNLNDIIKESKAGALSEKSQHDLDMIAAKSENMQLRTEALKVQNDIRDRDETRKENKNDVIGQNGLTSSEQRRYGSEISELNKKRSDIVSKGFDSNFTKKQLKAIDDRLDEIDSTIQDKRTATKPAAAPAPPAAPAPAAQGFQANPKWPAPATERSMMQDAKGKTIAKAVKGADGKLSWAAPTQ